MKPQDVVDEGATNNDHLNFFLDLQQNNRDVQHICGSAETNVVNIHSA